MNTLSEVCHICTGPTHCDSLHHVSGVVIAKLVGLDMITIHKPEYADIPQYRLICDRCRDYVRVMDKVIRIDDE